MQAALQNLGHNAIAVVMGSLSLIAGMLGGPRTLLVAPSQAGPQAASQAEIPQGMIAQTAIISAIQLSMQSMTSTATSSLTFPTSTASKATSSTSGLLPKVVLKKIAAATQTATTTSTSSATTSTKPTSPPPPLTSPPAPAPVAQTITAQSLLANATTSFASRVGGVYTVIFSSISQGKTIFVWSYGDTPIGGTGEVPKFDAAYSCNPPPNPLFSVRTSYDCTVSLTPLTGTDRRVQSHEFAFQTGPGELLATPPSSMSTLLTDSMNQGGFVFNNEDTGPVTIKDLTFDISYTGLNTVYGPLVLRIVNPTDETVYTDYHMESFPLDPSSQFTHSKTGVSVSLPFPFTVNGAYQKMLPIEVLGVHKMSVLGVDPTVTITLRGVSVDPSNVRTQINSPQISWSCVVVLGAYDPNATSGPAAVGTACRN